MAYLHSKRITHRDLKLENLLLADRADLGSVRLADFGLARAPRFPGDAADVMRLVCGTPTYVAPEIITGRPYGHAVDLWSAGVILFILLAGVVPFDDPEEQQAREKRSACVHARPLMRAAAATAGAQLYLKIARGAYSMHGGAWSAVSADARTLVRGLLTVDARCERIAERSVELLCDETRQTLLQLLARRRVHALALHADQLRGQLG